MNEIEKEVLDEVAAKAEKVAEPASLAVKSSWGDITAALCEAFKKWWAADHKQILSVAGDIFKSLIGYIVSEYNSNKESK